MVGRREWGVYVKWVFPWNQFEWYYEKTYDPRVPMCRRSDDAAMFLPGTRILLFSLDSQLVFRIDIFSHLPAERARLSTLGGFNDLFLTFIEGDASDHILDSDSVDYVPEI